MNPNSRPDASGREAQVEARANVTERQLQDNIISDWLSFEWDLSAISMEDNEIFRPGEISEQMYMNSMSWQLNDDFTALEESYTVQSNRERSFSDRSFSDRSFYDRSFSDRSFYDRSFYDRSFYDLSFYGRNFYDRSFYDRSFYDLENLRDQTVSNLSIGVQSTSGRSVTGQSTNSPIIFGQTAASGHNVRYKNSPSLNGFSPADSQIVNTRCIICGGTVSDDIYNSPSLKGQTASWRTTTKQKPKSRSDSRKSSVNGPGSCQVSFSALSASGRSVSGHSASGQNGKGYRSSGKSTENQGTSGQGASHQSGIGQCASGQGSSGGGDGRNPNDQSGNGYGGEGNSSQDDSDEDEEEDISDDQYAGQMKDQVLHKRCLEAMIKLESMSGRYRSREDVLEGYRHRHGSDMTDGANTFRDSWNSKSSSDDINHETNNFADNSQDEIMNISSISACLADANISVLVNVHTEEKKVKTIKRKATDVACAGEPKTKRGNIAASTVNMDVTPPSSSTARDTSR